MRQRNVFEQTVPYRRVPPYTVICLSRNQDVLTIRRCSG